MMHSTHPTRGSHNPPPCNPLPSSSPHHPLCSMCLIRSVPCVSRCDQRQLPSCSPIPPPPPSLPCTSSTHLALTPLSDSSRQDASLDRVHRFRRKLSHSPAAAAAAACTPLGTSQAVPERRAVRESRPWERRPAEAVPGPAPVLFLGQHPLLLIAAPRLCLLLGLSPSFCRHPYTYFRSKPCRRRSVLFRGQWLIYL